MGEAARRHAEEHFGWDDIARRLEEIYERVVGGDRTRAGEAVAA
jgi:glycosyltransferase involved in cell wall biosynthesis